MLITSNGEEIYVGIVNADGEIAGTYSGLIVFSGDAADTQGIIYYSPGEVTQSDIIISNGAIRVESDGNVSDVAVDSNGTLYLEGGSATNISGFYESEILDEWGSITSLIVNSGSDAVFSQEYRSGVVDSVTINAGGVALAAGGNASNVVVNSGGYLSVDGGDLYYPGSVVGIIVNAGGYFYVGFGGTADGVLIEGGDVVLNSGTIDGLIINESGSTSVLYDGHVENVDVWGGGYIDLIASTYLSGLEISAYGSADIYGSASDIYVSAGGVLFVDSGGSVSGLTIGGGDATFLGDNMVNAPVNFAGSGGLLVLEAPTSLDPTISGFAAGDTIGLADVTSATSATWSGGVLAIATANSGTIDLNLAGNYSGEKFIAESDQAGGTTITVDPNSLTLSFTNALIEGSSGTLIISASSAVDKNETFQLSISDGSAEASEITGLPASVVLSAGQTSVSAAFDISADPLAPTDPETFTISADAPDGGASIAGDINEFVTKPFVFTTDGGFTFNSAMNVMEASGDIDVALTAAPGSPVAEIESAMASYNDVQFGASGEVDAVEGDTLVGLFDGSFVLPYSGLSTTSLSDTTPDDDKFELAGLDVTFEQLTFESGALLAGFSLTLPFFGVNLAIDTASWGVNYGLSFSASGTQLVFGAAVSFPDSPPVSVFGLFTGSISDASLSYTASTDTLELQGTFAATGILGSSLSATVNFSGSNYIKFQDGTPSFAGSLTISGITAPSASGGPAFGINTVVLTVDTGAKTLGGEVDFTFPFGSRAPEGDVTIEGSWANAPTITEVEVSFTNLSIVVPDTPLIWQSASVGISNMFSATLPTTFSGSLGFSFGPKLNGAYAGALTLNGQGSAQQLTGTESLQFLPYSLASSLTGGALNGAVSLFPVFSTTGTVTANFAPGSVFQNFTFVGAASVFGNFITLNQSFKADANLDFTIAGQAMVNFGSSLFANISGYKITASANYLISYTSNAPLTSDYAEAWFTTGLGILNASLTIGLKSDFEGDVSVLYSAPSSLAQSSAANQAKLAAPEPSSSEATSSGSAEAASPTILLLTLAWTTAATQPVTLSVTTPTGAVIQQADFTANNIAIVSALSTAYSETIAIVDPTTTSGWSVNVSSAASLGSVSIKAQTPAAAPSISSLALAGVNADGTLAVDYDLAAIGNGSTVTFFADQDGRNFDGVVLGQNTDPTDGNGSTNLSLGSLSDGVWYVYASVDNGAAIPDDVYAVGWVAITKPNAVAFTNSDPLVDPTRDSFYGTPFGSSLSNILITNTNGAVVVGQLVGGQESYAQVSGLPPGWTFQGDGYFLGDNADGDFLIENANGAVDVGAVAGDAVSYTQVTALGPEWRFVGTGDFLGDGQSQFLIENTAGAVVVGEVVNGTTQFTQVTGLGPEWTFVGDGDFMGDGKTDFLIENTAGAVVVGEVVSGTAQFTQVAGLGPEWKFEETGDFLGDGQNDFLIENTAGTVVVGAVAHGQTTYTQVGGLGPEWTFVGAGDYTGTGIDSFMIENTAGAVVIGTVVAGKAQYTQVSGLGSQWAFHN